MIRSRIVGFVTCACLADGAVLASSQAALVSSSARTGEELYRSGCVSCHGVDGTGGVSELMGFTSPNLPDFTACSFSTPEPDSDWLAIIHEGGTARAFSRRMPSFKDLLTDEEIEGIVTYLRGSCTDRRWPLGDLNLPRALFTEKAFPENESLMTTVIDRSAAARVGHSFTYEHRVGARSQWELSVPIELQKSAGSWVGGLGDVTAAFKHVLHHDLERGDILSVGSELLLPTGSENRGLGKGVTVVEPFLAYGRLLPSDGFLQLHTGIELPTRTRKASQEAFLRAAVGKSFTQTAWGRSWSPMAELLAAHEMVAGEPTLWDVVPQLQVTLSRRQHVLMSGGVRLPINQRSERGVQVVTYFLWDWFDGGLFEGWK
jgi:mono/diheme cytochrome c family protein